MAEVLERPAFEAPFGEVLQYCRLWSKFSTRTLAKHCLDVSASEAQVKAVMRGIQRWESGKVVPSLAQYQRLAQELPELLKWPLPLHPAAPQKRVRAVKEVRVAQQVQEQLGDKLPEMLGWLQQQKVTITITFDKR